MEEKPVTTNREALILQTPWACKQHCDESCVRSEELVPKLFEANYPIKFVNAKFEEKKILFLATAFYM